MPKIYPSQENFAAGELSPLLYSRTTIEARAAGVQEASNVLCRAQGPLQRRPGFRFRENTGEPYVKTFGVYAVTTGIGVPPYEYTPCFVSFTGNASNPMLAWTADGVPMTVASPLTNTPPYNTYKVYELRMEQSPDGLYCVLVHPDHHPMVFYYDRVAAQWDIEYINFTGTYTTPNGALPGTPGKVTGWGDASGGDDEWPSTVTFFQGRSWWSGVRSYPERVWGSDAYTSPTSWSIFTTPSGAADSIDVYHTKQGQINWILGASKLIVASENHEAILTGDDGLVATGSNIRFEIQSRYGSNTTQPVLMGDRVVCVSVNGRKIRDMDYEWTKDRWVTRDILYASEHLTEGSPVTDIAFVQYPKPTIYALLDDDTLLMGTYEKGNDVIGWSKVETQGRCVTIAGLKNLDGNSILAAFFDRMSISEFYFETHDLSDIASINCGLDSFVYSLSGTPTLNLPTCAHLPNTTVGVITDGTLHPDVTTDAGGAGTLDWTRLEAYAGLNYIGKAKTLPPIMQLSNGSNRAFKKKYSQIHVTMKDPNYPLINGQRVSMKHTGITDVSVREIGWDNEGSIEIQLDKPFDCQVLCIHGEMNIENV